MAHVVYAFGVYRLDVAARELHRDGELLVLPASVFDCLTYLVEHRDRAVGRDELIAAVWGRADVTDTVLGQTVLRARRALGDDGNAQHTIRTVPRFGYRWVAEVERCEEGVPAPVPPSADTSVGESAPPAGLAGNRSAETGGALTPEADRPPVAASDPRAAAIRARPRLAVIVALAALLLLALAALAAVWWQRPAGGDVASARTGAAPDAAEPVRALVLPAGIDAGSDWSWLRLGLMDLIADRLQQARLATVPSESVVAIVQGGEDALSLADPGLVALAYWRVRPRARLDDGRWSVTLEVASDAEGFEVASEGADVVQVTRMAADAMLQRLGRHVPSTGEGPPELDALMQRTRAAMLEDQFELARALVRDAPASLRERPELVHRLAQIELRAGRYRLVQQLIDNLLERLPADVQPVMRARALITLAASHIRRNEREPAGLAYEEAIALLEDRQEPAALGLAYLGRGLVAALGNQLDTATAELGRARVEMESAGDALGLAQVDLNLGVFDDMRQRPADALPKLEASAQRFESLRSLEELNYALTRVATVQNRLLEHSAAYATTDRFWPADSHSGSERLRWALFLTRARVLLHLGRLAEAHLLFERLLAESDPELDRDLRAGAAAGLAELAFWRDDASQTASLAEAAMTPVLAQIDPARYLRIAVIRMQATSQAGRIIDAPELRRWRMAAAADRANPLLPAYGHLLDAQSASIAGDWAAAQTAFAQALERVEAVPVADDLVEVSYRYTLALIAQGELAAAQAVAGRISPWAERDVRAAWAQSCLFAALHNRAMQAQAARRVRSLAGERRLPPGAGCPARPATANERTEDAPGP